ncbi:MAG: tetratricopeptide repeat protein [Allomuricauda sp.]
MNVADFIHILQNANTILSPSQTRELEDIIEEYPYFQAARALHLKGLKNLDSYKYNNALKVTAAHTADRDVLFDYITSKEFIQNNIADTIAGRGAKLEDQEAVSEEIQPNPNAASMLTEAEEAALPQNLGDAEQILNPELFESRKQEVVPEKAGEETKETDLQLGKPLPFTKKEKHSFTEWLQLTSKGEEPENSQEDVMEELERKKKFELLDKFIANNPKIVPKENNPKVNIKESTKINQNELMTETLAKVYLEQKKYKKAIQAFKILSLKYPEKSGFFADQIQAVKKLQQEKDKK